MFEIVDLTDGAIVATADLWHSAADIQTFVQKRTLRPHVIRHAIAAAVETVEGSK